MPYPNFELIEILPFIRSKNYLHVDKPSPTPWTDPDDPDLLVLLI